MILVESQITAAIKRLLQNRTFGLVRIFFFHVSHVVQRRQNDLSLAWQMLFF